MTKNKDEMTSMDALIAHSKWIDEHNKHKPVGQQVWERTAKVSEEAGEVIGAMIALTGQNPRKAHVPENEARHRVIDELLDTAVAALGAVEYLTGHQGHSFQMLDRHIVTVAIRAGVA